MFQTKWDGEKLTLLVDNIKSFALSKPGASSGGSHVQLERQDGEAQWLEDRRV